MAEPVTNVTPLGFRAWTGRAAGMAAEHVHGDAEINFSTTGEFRYLLGGERVSIPPGRLGVFWATVPHRFVEMAGDGEALGYWVTVPLHLVLGWSLPDGFVRDLLAGRMLVERAARASDVLQLTQWSEDLRAGAGEGRQKTAALEVEARLRRMAMEHGWTALARRPRRDKRNSTPPRESDVAERMARFIAARYADAIGVADVARHVHLHPNYAMTLFRARMGTSIGEHLTRQRVAHAQRLLVTTDRPVLEVGFDAGFGSVSRYYAAFKHITGRSPKAYRKAVRPG